MRGQSRVGPVPPPPDPQPRQGGNSGTAHTEFTLHPRVTALHCCRPCCPPGGHSLAPNAAEGDIRSQHPPHPKSQPQRSAPRSQRGGIRRETAIHAQALRGAALLVSETFRTAINPPRAVITPLRGRGRRVPTPRNGRMEPNAALGQNARSQPLLCRWTNAADPRPASPPLHPPPRRCPHLRPHPQHAVRAQGGDAVPPSQPPTDGPGATVRPIP